MAFYDTWDSIFTAFDYRCNDSSGSMANEGTGFDLAANTSLAGSVITFSSDAPPMGGSSIYMDNGGYFRRSGPGGGPYDTATEGTIAMVFKINTPDEAHYLYHSHASGTNAIELNVSSAGRLNLLLDKTTGSGASVYQVYTDLIDADDGEWHLVVIRQKNDNTGLEIFMDGTTNLVDTTTLTGPDLTTNSWASDIYGASDGDLYIGIDGWNQIQSQALDGWIGSWGEIDSAISDATLSTLMSEWNALTAFAEKTIRRRGRRLYADLTAV